MATRVAKMRWHAGNRRWIAAVLLARAEAVLAMAPPLLARAETRVGHMQADRRGSKQSSERPCNH
jgi:hypothetical protein